MTRTFTWRRTTRWTDRRIRTCYTMHKCALGPALGTCDGTIRLGEKYRDGGYGKRAHVHCADDPRTVQADAERAERNGESFAHAVVNAWRKGQIS